MCVEMHMSCVHCVFDILQVQLTQFAIVFSVHNHILMSLNYFERYRLIVYQRMLRVLLIHIQSSQIIVNKNFLCSQHV